VIPSAGTPIKIKDIIKAVIFSCDFEDEIKRMLGVNYAFAVNSGTTAFYIILSVLKKLSDKREVILPAYTAPSLLLPIKKAGLEYRLVDVSLDTFNMDTEKLAEVISDNTLAVLFIHMFGIPVEMEKSKNIKGVFRIEDAASSFGTRRGKQFTGTFCDIGFVSFNRGKNLSTVSGGVIVTDNLQFADAVKRRMADLSRPSPFARVKIFLKALGLSLAVRPWFYSIFRHIVSGFKYTSLHEDFDSYHYTKFQGSLGCLLQERSETIFLDREAKGNLLYNGLKNIKGIRLPCLPDDWRIVFNQFPFLVEDAKKRMKVLDAIIKAGVEATMLYDKPIHKIYDEPHKDYPNAEYMADRLILIPVHHYVTERSLYKLLEAIETEIKK